MLTEEFTPALVEPFYIFSWRKRQSYKLLCCIGNDFEEVMYTLNSFGVT